MGLETCWQRFGQYIYIYIYIFIHIYMYYIYIYIYWYSEFSFISNLNMNVFDFSRLKSTLDKTDVKFYMCNFLVFISTGSFQHIKLADRNCRLELGLFLHWGLRNPLAAIWAVSWWFIETVVWNLASFFTVGLETRLQRFGPFLNDIWFSLWKS